MIGGRIETGVAPSAASNVPTPTLISITCTARSSAASVFMNATSRRIAPASSITLIWKMEVTTIRLTGKLATAPASEASRITCHDVPKKNAASAAV